MKKSTPQTNEATIFQHTKVPKIRMQDAKILGFILFLTLLLAGVMSYFVMSKMRADSMHSNQKISTITESIVSFCSLRVVHSSRAITETVRVPTEDIACGTKGKAFFISSDGRLMTSAHLVDTGSIAYQIQTSSGNIYLPKFESLDSAMDTAVLKLQNVVSIPLLSASWAHSWQVVQIHFGENGTLLTGTIIADNKSANVSLDSLAPGLMFTGLLLVDLPVESGESGSPLLDMSGSVVAMIMAKSREGSGGYAVRVVDRW